MTRVIRNKLTGKFVNIDLILVEPFEYEDIKQATIFNEEVDEMTDVDIIEFVARLYAKMSISNPKKTDLEIVPIKITIDIL